MTATNENISKEAIVTEDNIPNRDTTNETVEKDYSDIDAACDLFDHAMKERDKKKADDDQKAANEAAKKASEDAKMVERLEREKEEQENKERMEKIKSIRAFRKNCAKNMTFWMAIICAVCTTCISSFIIWTLFKPDAWVFASIMSAITMVSTIIYTYLYRYIREAIYRK